MLVHVLEPVGKTHPPPTGVSDQKGGYAEGNTDTAVQVRGATAMGNYSSTKAAQSGPPGTPYTALWPPRSNRQQQ